MAFEFVPLQVSEQPDLIQFLLDSFHVERISNSFRPDVMRWKYFVDDPAWKGPRSLAVKEDGQIVAHGGVWPVSLVTPKGEIKAINLIDWAASRSAVGAGVHLLRKMAGLADILLTIGGSQDTRTLLPKLGYKRCGELRRYARVVRPWLQFRTTSRKNWKTPIKLLKNSASAATGIPAVSSEWQVSKITNFAGSIEDSAFDPMSKPMTPRRTTTGLDYQLSCPAGRFSGFLVTQRERLRGYFLLAQLERQTRIVDIRIDSQEQDSWQGICTLALRTAAADPDTCEVVAGSSTEIAGDAWLRTGFAHRRTDQILCYDPRNLLGTEPALNLTMTDGDICFLYDPSSPYLS